jgi:hypothetical protein
MKLGNGARRERRRDLDHIGHADDGGDRRGVAVKHEAELAVERGVDRVRCGDDEQSIAVGCGIDDRFGADIAGRPGTVLDHELPAEPIRQPLADQAGGDVGGAAGRESDDHPHRPRRIGLRHRRPRERQRRGAAGHREKSAAMKSHRRASKLTRAPCRSS